MQSSASGKFVGLRFVGAKVLESGRISRELAKVRGIVEWMASVDKNGQL